MKNNNNINEIIRQIKEYSELQAQLKVELDNLKAEAIEWLNSQGTDEAITDEGKITYREVISRRFNSTAFKKDFGDIYDVYCKPSSSMRFTCS